MTSRNEVTGDNLVSKVLVGESLNRFQENFDKIFESESLSTKQEVEIRIKEDGTPYHPDAFPELTAYEHTVQRAAYDNTDKLGKDWLTSEASADWRTSHGVVALKKWYPLAGSSESI